MATMRTLKGTWIWAATALLLAAGCEQQFEQDAAAPPTPPTPPAADELNLLQKTTAGVDVVGETVKIASNTIVDDGTMGGATIASANRGERVSQANSPGSSIEFHATLDAIIDLDNQTPTGEDQYPNATGVIHVVANGSIMGNEFLGSATYDVTVTFETDTTFTDPASGAQATISQGATLSFSVAVDWDKYDKENWTVNADAEAWVTNLSVFVTDHIGSGTVTLEAYRHDVGTFGLDEGVLFMRRSVEGFWDATFSNGSETHTVRVDIINLGRIFITIDGEQHGPYTAWELEALYGVTID